MLVSISTDGTLCHWDLGSLSEPTLTLSLATPGPSAALATGKNYFTSVRVHLHLIVCPCCCREQGGAHVRLVPVVRPRQCER